MVFGLMLLLLACFGAGVWLLMSRHMRKYTHHQTRPAVQPPFRPVQHNVRAAKPLPEPIRTRRPTPPRAGDEPQDPADRRFELWWDD